jgi:signal peptidase I
MNKSLTILIVVAGCVVGLWIIGRLTNMLQYFSSPTTTNYPTIKKGDHLFASNLKKPKRFDFICYSASNAELGKHIRVHRLCGIEGDKIEIRNGDLYVNNEPVDNNLSISYPYVMSRPDLKTLEESEFIDEWSVQDLSADSVVTYMSTKSIISHSIKARRYILDKDYEDKLISIKFSRAWNQDHFGPIVVPKGKYFVLGDNRLASEDSRYLGFIDKDDYVATALVE